MNLPNIITLSRIALIPVMAVFFYLTVIPYNYLIAAVIFLLCAFTDFLDGYIARKKNLVTNMGKFLDPIADKVLIAAALIFLCGVNAIKIPCFLEIGTALILARELIIGGFRQVAAANNVIIAADRSGKLKTVVQDIAVVLVFLICEEKLKNNVLDYFAYSVFGLAVVLTIYSGVAYIVKNKQVLK